MSYFTDEISDLLASATLPLGIDLEFWGHEACKASRRAHLRVWNHPRRAPDDVRELLWLLTQAIDRLKACPECAIFTRNISIRRDSLERYLTGGVPLIPTDAGPDESALVERFGAQRAKVMRPYTVCKALEVADELERQWFPERFVADPVTQRLSDSKPTSVPSTSVAPS